MPSSHSPARILTEALIDATKVVDPVVDPDGQWRGFTNQIPDEDDVIGIFSATGVKDGRDIGNGPNFWHPGWQIMIRGKDPETAYNKLDDISEWLETVLRLAVTIAASSYTIQAVTQAGPILDLGQESESRRQRYTLNGTMTLK